MEMRRIVARGMLVLLLSGAVVVAGCGGRKDGGEAKPPAPTYTAEQAANTKGLLTSTGQPKLVNSDTTEWAVAHDRTNLKTYIRTYNGLEIQMVDLKKLNFDGLQ